jgi:hypothetical protein
MKIQLGRKTSDWLVALYLISGLGIRLIIEPQLQGQFLLSVGIGAFSLLFLWALCKSRILNPSFFRVNDD